MITIEIRQLPSQVGLRFGNTYAIDRYKNGELFGSKQHKKFFTTYKLAKEYVLWLEDFYNCLGILTKCKL